MTPKKIICLSIILALMALDVQCSNGDNSDGTLVPLNIILLYRLQTFQINDKDQKYLFNTLYAVAQFFQDFIKVREINSEFKLSRDCFNKEQQSSEIMAKDSEIYFFINIQREQKEHFLNVRSCSFEKEINRPNAGIININEELFRDFEEQKFQEVVYAMIHEFLQFFVFSRDLLQIQENDLGIMEKNDSLLTKNLNQILIKSNKLMKKTEEIINESDASRTTTEPWYTNIIKTEIIETSFQSSSWTPSQKTVNLLKGTGQWDDVNENFVAKEEEKEERMRRGDQCSENCYSNGICILGTCHCFRHSDFGQFCHNNSQKDSCSDDEVLNPDNVCRTTCPHGFYKDLGYGICQTCDFSCSKCSGPLKSNCLDCQQLTFLIDNTCVYNCPDGLSPNLQTKKCEKNSQKTNNTNVIKTNEQSSDSESGSMNNNSHSATNNGRDSNIQNRSNFGQSGEINDNKPSTTNNRRNSDIQSQSNSDSDEEQSLKIPKDCIQALLVKGKLGMQCIQCKYPLIVDDGKCVESCGERDWYSKCIQDFSY